MARILLGACYVRLSAHGGHFRPSDRITTHRKQHSEAYRTAAQWPGLHDSGRLGTHGNTEKLG